MKPTDMNITPRVSVIIPTYNDSKYIEETVKSVLDQTFTDFELIIIDDCSTDNTVDLAKSFNDPRVQVYVNEKNIGNGESRNRGISLAKGEFCAMLDHDDVCYADRLQIEVDFLDSRPDIDICSGLLTFIDENSKPLSGKSYRDVITHDQIKIRSLFTCSVANVTLMFRREKYLANDIKYESGITDDMTMYYLALDKLRFENMNDIPLVKYRLSSTQFSVKAPYREKTQAMEILRKTHQRLGIDVDENYLDMLVWIALYEVPFDKMDDFYRFSINLLEANRKTQQYDEGELSHRLLYTNWRLYKRNRRDKNRSFTEKLELRKKSRAFERDMGKYHDHYKGNSPLKVKRFSFLW